MDFQLKEKFTNAIDKTLQVVKAQKEEIASLKNQISQLKSQIVTLQEKNINLEQTINETIRDERNAFNIEKQQLLEIIQEQTAEIASLKEKTEIQSDYKTEIENKLMEIMACLPGEEDSVNEETINNDVVEQPEIDPAEAVMQKIDSQLDFSDEQADVNQMLQDFQIDSNNMDDAVSPESVVTSKEFEINQTDDAELLLNSFDFAEKNDNNADNGALFEEQQSIFVEEIGENQQLEQTPIEPEEQVAEENIEQKRETEFDTDFLSNIVQQDAVPDIQLQQEEPSLDFVSPITTQQEESQQSEQSSEQTDILSTISNDDYNPLLIDDETDTSDMSFDLPEEDDSEDENDDNGEGFKDGWADGVL